MNHGNLNWWGEYIKNVYIPQIGAYGNVLKTRLLPAFSDLTKEADEIADKYWNTPPDNFYREYIDGSELAEYAFNKGEISAFSQS
jgi:hypothetical protein